MLGGDPLLDYQNRACCLVNDDTNPLSYEEVCQDNPDDDDDNNNTGLIVGVSVGGVALICVLVACMTYCCGTAPDPESTSGPSKTNTATVSPETTTTTVLKTTTNNNNAPESYPASPTSATSTTNQYSSTLGMCAVGPPLTQQLEEEDIFVGSTPSSTTATTTGYAHPSSNPSWIPPSMNEATAPSLREADV